jgi:hypothetical protein
MKFMDTDRKAVGKRGLQLQLEPNKSRYTTSKMGSRMRFAQLMPCLLYKQAECSTSRNHSWEALQLTPELKETRSMRNNRKVHAFLLVLLGIVLALTAPVAGGMKATFGAGGGPAGSSWSEDAALLRRLMSTRLEDGVAPELTVDLELHRRVLLGGSIRPSVFTPDRPACLRPCPAQGRPYTNRGCEKIYRCHG